MDIKTFERVQNFKYIPNFNDLKLNETSYLREDLADLEAAISSSFTQENGIIDVIPLTFFRTFINKQASLYTGTFERKGFKNDKKIDVETLDNELKYVNRYCHRDRRSLIYYYSEDDMIQFKAISSLNYFKQGDYTFIQDTDEKVILFHRGIITEEEISQEIPLLEGVVEAGEIVKVYEISKIDDKNSDKVNNDISMYDVVSNWNLLREPLSQSMFSTDGTGVKAYNIEDTNETYPIFPFSEIAYRDSKKAGRNYVSTLEMRYIKDMSFGVYHAEPKLVTHVILSGEFANKDEAADSAKDFGKRNKFTIVPTSTEAKIFEAGNLNVLKDMVEAFNGFISQQCQINGVDFHALIPQSKIGNDVESGESKKLVMDYINEYRRDFYTDYQKFEREIFSNINILWGIDNEGIKINFQDLEPSETKKDRLDYSILARDNSLMTQNEALAYSRKISIEDAEALDIVDIVEENETSNNNEDIE